MRRLAAHLWTGKKRGKKCISSLPFLWQWTFLTTIPVGSVFKHIQHPHNFDSRPVSWLVITQTNVEQYTALMLCLWLPGTSDYPWSISPLWAFSWNYPQQYLASGLSDSRSVMNYGSFSLCLAPIWNIIQYEWASLQPTSIHSLNKCIPFLLVNSQISSSTFEMPVVSLISISTVYSSGGRLQPCGSGYLNIQIV